MQKIAILCTALPTAAREDYKMGVTKGVARFVVGERHGQRIE